MLAQKSTFLIHLSLTFVNFKGNILDIFEKMRFDIKKYHFISGSILEGLPKNELALLKERMIRKELKKDTFIFREGSYPKGVYFLRRGKVKIYQTGVEGKEQIAYIYTKGETFGYRPILCDGTHPASAKTLEDSVVSFIPLDSFRKVLSQSPTLSNKLLRNLSHEFAVWINRISAFGQKGLRERIALSLLILNEKYKRKGKEHRVEISLSRDDFANYVGTSIEPLVRVLRSFKDEKLIRTKGRKIIVLDTRKLEKIAEFY